MLDRAGSGKMIGLLMLVFAYVLLLHPVAAAPMQAEATTPAREEPRLVPFGETDPTSDELAQRLPPVRYQPAASGEPDLIVVYFIVLRPADMKVAFMSTETESGDPAFDEAVKEAILAAKPFARGTSYSFSASFRGRYEDAAAPGTQGGRAFVVTPTVPPNDSPLNMPRTLP